MNFKKIVSALLVAVMLFSAVLVLIPPVEAEAAYTAGTATSQAKTAAEIKAIVTAAAGYSFSSNEEMLQYELDKGYLDSVTAKNGLYTMYLNRYTGVLYYVNNATGQILTSNPCAPGTASDAATRQTLISQLEVVLNEISTNQSKPFNSTQDAAQRGQITTQFINGGFRVNYTMGDTSTRYLAPGRIMASELEALILIPMIEHYDRLLNEALEEAGIEANNNFFTNESYTPYLYDLLNVTGAKGFRYYADAMQKEYRRYLGTYATQLQSLSRSLLMLCNTIYTGVSEAKFKVVGDKAYNQMIKDYYSDPDSEIYADRTPIYVLSDPTDKTRKRTVANLFSTYAPDYSFTDMSADEDACGFKAEVQQSPVVRCSLEYTFNDDGSLSVRLPANSLTFDTTVYTLTSIIPLKFFGAGDMSKDGYIFYPDGSGTIVDFEDFYGSGINLALSGQVYGLDYCYSTLPAVNVARHEQITMPIYGIVNQVTAGSATQQLIGKTTVTNGFFAVLEEGAALASLAYYSYNAHRFGAAYASFQPYPSDTYTLSSAVASGSSNTYTKVSDCKYNGSYVTRYVMLTDDAVGQQQYGAGNYYPASYVGMAAYYRDYLKADGTLSAIQTLDGNLPLYIESFGAMEIIAKVLSFPVSKKIPLTTFDNVATMYDDFSKAKDKYLSLAEDYEAQAAAESDAQKREEYTVLAESYRALYEQAVNITNINFRLTGFSNGGMEYTYPVKIKWDRVCGGKSGYAALVAKALNVSDGVSANLGIYPDFDFMYINNTATFDGISNKGNVSRMIDNRYASKQTYNTVAAAYVNYYTMVITPDALDRLFSIFEHRYVNYGSYKISLSTLGSDLNSNFDEDAPVNRDEAQKYVQSLLQRISESGYDIMADTGNVYALKYAKHLLNVSTDSSHFRYASYAVPFVGMVLHGSINYTGTPLNYSGTPDYDLLRSIESGASLYYILCYDNTSYMKEDESLNRFYGVDYASWYDQVVTTYAKLNAAIGDLQGYHIVDHRILLGERVIEASEQQNNYRTLQSELLEMIDAQLSAAVDKAYEDLREDGAALGQDIHLTVDREALHAQLSEILQLTQLPADFLTAFDAVITSYEQEYAGNSGSYELRFSELDYQSRYSYITTSLATDGKDYIRTDYTSDVNNIVMVTYSDGNNEVSFLLNYNIYSVTVRLSETEVYTLGQYDYIRFD